jgi:hypothetical protein
MLTLKVIIRRGGSDAARRRVNDLIAVGDDQPHKSWHTHQDSG